MSVDKKNWQTTRPTIRERSKFIFNNDLFSDVRFVVQTAAQGESESKQVIPAHKFVLSVSSPVFEAMFYGELAETTDSIELPDCEYDSLLELFPYMYSDEVILSGSNVMGVLYLAKKYMVPSLADKCTKYLQDNLHYAKPNVAIFNIDIFIQFNPYSFNLIFIFIQFNLRSFNSIPIVILFNPHSFNSIFRSIQFNFCILLIQFQYWFNLISIFIQFDFYIHSIQLLYSFNSISNSFDSIFIFIQFNPSLFIQSSYSFIQFGGLGRGGKFERELGHMVKMADEMVEDEE